MRPVSRIMPARNNEKAKAQHQSLESQTNVEPPTPKSPGGLEEFVDHKP
jgi:hypothetical protein